MKILKAILLVVAALFVAIQFIRPERNTVQGGMSRSLVAAHDVPPGIQAILETSCYDCHSNSTRYPWYAEIQPVSWFLNNHIVDGKRHLNFSEFGGYRLRRQYHKLEEIVEMVGAGEMPLSSYTLIHTDAKLSAEQKERLIGWAHALRDTMKATYPVDSLEGRM